MVTCQTLERGVVATVTALVCLQCVRQPLLHLSTFVSAFLVMQCLILITVQHTRQQPTQNPESLYRLAGDEGLINIMLVPLAVVADHLSLLNQSHGRFHDCSDVYLVLVSTVAVSIATLSRLEPSHVKEGMMGGSTFHLLLEVLTSLWILPLMNSLDGIRVALIMTFALVTLLAARSLPKIAPHSFTPGEASLFVQLVSLFVWRVISWPLAVDLSEIPDIKIVSTLGLVAMVTATAVLGLARDKVFGFFLVFPAVALTWLLPALVCVLGTNPVSWLAAFLLQSWARIQLLVFWAGLAVLAGLVVVVYSFSSNHGKAISLATRKVFHLLVTAVYMPGLANDLPFLYLASVVALAVFILIEVVRLYNIPPFGKALRESYEMFRDDRDQGEIILTNIYLLVGMSLPIWLSQAPLSNRGTLPLYAGLLSLGVGDTMASLGGMMLGFHRWPESQRTLEGSLCSVAFQLVVVSFLFIHGLVQAWSLWSVLVAVVLSTLHEATTHQIDNLVLPLSMFSLLSLGQPAFL